VAERHNLPIFLTLWQMKVSVSDSDALGDVAGQAYIENFSLRVFESADVEDRAGRATKYVLPACIPAGRS
jgi:vacuolar protein sorting-associated protein VTA1